MADCLRFPSPFCCSRAAEVPTTAGPDGGGTTTGTFQLAWEDNFDAFDATRWALQTHSWDSNLAQFSTTNTTFANGIASLTLTPEPTDTVKPFRGVEMRSRDTLTYGKVESRIRFAKGSGVVSSLVLIYTPWPADDWNELDIEVLGRYSDRAADERHGLHRPADDAAGRAVGDADAVSRSWRRSTFDPSADFHDYTIEWTPTEARFTIDGELKRTWSTHDRPAEAAPEHPADDLGVVRRRAGRARSTPTTAPTSADYDWIRVYNWVP